MGLRLFDKKDDRKSGYPSSIGGKIKRYRELRGLTQQELGIKCGFNSSSAKVRINQYEKNKKVPQEEVINAIAQALDVSKYAFYDDKFLNIFSIYHALFDIEDLFGLHPCKIEDDYYLRFGDSLIKEYFHDDTDFRTFIKAWYEKRKQVIETSSGSVEVDEEKFATYDLWRASYPSSMYEDIEEQKADQERMKKLQEEMDELYIRMNGTNALKRLDAALSPYFCDENIKSIAITKEAELVYMIRNMVEQGVIIVKNLVGAVPNIYYPCRDLIVGIDVEDLLADEKKIKLYAELCHAFSSLKRYNFVIERKIVSLEKRLYVAHTIHIVLVEYFSKIHKSIDAMAHIKQKIALEHAVDPDICESYLKSLAEDPEVDYSTIDVDEIMSHVEERKR